MRILVTTQEHLAAVASKNHRHSTMNPLAQYQQDMSIEEVLNAPMIAWPLTLPMCSPISDGAAAALLCTRAALSRFNDRSEEHTSELQSLMRISYAVFCLNKKNY